NLDKELSFTNQFLEEKPQEDEPEKTNTKSEVHSIIVHALILTSTTTTTAITTTISLPPPPLQLQQSSSDLILLERIGELKQHIADLIQSNLPLEKSDLSAVDIKEVLQQRMFEDKSYLADEDHKNLFEALKKSLERDHSNQLLSDLEEACMKKRKKRASPRTPSSKAPSLSKTATSTPQSMAWTTSGTRYELTSVSATHESSPIDSLMNEDSIPEEQASTLVSTYEPPAKNLLLAKIGDMTTFMNWYCSKVNKTVLTQVDFKGQTYEVAKAFYPDVIYMQF
ncbi:hypothetical protein Tco_1097048, partial [Tanacetum coccineum]